MIAIQDIAYVRYEVPDLDVMEAFLLDFGLHRAARTEQALYMRSCGPLHHAHVSERGTGSRTLGFGLLAQQASDLDRLAAHLGKAVEDNPEPGGGKRVRFTDPAGFLVDVIHGQETLSELPHREPLPVNGARQRHRVGEAVRLRPAPSSVMRLGHVAILVAHFADTQAFYRDVLGMRVADTFWAGSEAHTIAAFMRCGLGKAWTDHHTIVMMAAPDGISRFDHAAYEVLDMDDVFQGGEYLKQRSHFRSWGIGRHIQGSQVFDYWRDPFGKKIEHWTDGDLVNDDTPVGHSQVKDDELMQWGPPMSPEFFT